MTSADMRHAVPLPISDRFAYLERNGTRYALANQLEEPRITAVGGYEILRPRDLGLDELVEQGLTFPLLGLNILLRGCREVGLEEAAVPMAFPLDAADFLRENGVSLRVDHRLFELRRRVKNDAELAGMRRAQTLAETIMATIREALRRGGDLTSEGVRAEARASIAGADAFVDALFAQVGDQALSGHDPGTGPIAAGQSVVVDLGIRDGESGCYTDMSRTFCSGEPSPELAAMHAACREALDVAYPLIRAGVTGAEVDGAVCELFEERGYRTRLSKKPGEILDEDFFHSLGHGVGLEIHELPAISRVGHDPLLAGDVIAIEPGLYRRGVGGVRLEDLVLVTDEGCEVLADFPYELTVY
jgi:Xaa-Pro aminopeptidase